MLAEVGYVNARIGGRKKDLLDPSGMNSFLEAKTLPDFYALLRSTAYGPDLNRTLQKYRGVEAAEKAMMTNYADSCRKILVTSPPSLQPLIRSLLTTWDARNLVTIFRALHHRSGIQQAAAALVPAGQLDEPALMELLTREGVIDACQMMATWKMPWIDPLLKTLPTYQKTGRLIWMEMAVLQGVYGTALDDVKGPGINRVLVREVLGRQIDCMIIMTKVRLLDEGIPTRARTRAEEKARDRKIKKRRAQLARKIRIRNRQEALSGEAYHKAFLRQKSLMKKGERGPGLEKIKVPVLRPEDLILHGGYEFSKDRLIALLKATDHGAVIRELSSTFYAQGLGREMVAMETIIDPVVLERGLEELLVKRFAGLYRDYPLTMAAVISFLWRKWAEVVNLRIALRGKAYQMPKEAIAGEWYHVR